MLEQQVYETQAIRPVPYHGQRYADNIPDTLDIAERAALAVNGVTGPMDPEAEYELYWAVRFYHNPPFMYHDWNDWCEYKFWEALPLLRLISGSELRNHIDPVWMQRLQNAIGPDGGYYIPLHDRSWRKKNVYWADGIYLPDGSRISLEDASADCITHPYVCGRIIGVMTVYYLRDRNPRWMQMIERMIDRMAELAVDRDDYAYFPNAAFAPFATVPPDAPMPVGIMAAEGSGRLLPGLVQYYRISGYEPARVLAGKLVIFLLHHSGYFSPDGAFLERQEDLPEPHFHAHTLALQSIQEYAMAVDNRELIAFVQRGYEWARDHEVSHPLTGFFPERMNITHPYVETCEVADMIALALKLTEAGQGDYRDDADRWIRNQFAENQLTDTSWVEKVSTPLVYAELAENYSADRVAERNLGAFAGWATPNEWDLKWGIQHCCTGNATRALYYIWEHILSVNEDGVSLHLLLNHASPAADIYSYIPSDGRVDLSMKQSSRQVRVRMPEWISDGDTQVACSVNDLPRAFTWEGRYLNLGAVNAGDRISVTFPITERTVREVIAGNPYTLTIKGNTVVAVDPPGTQCPTYQREHYRTGPVQWKQVTRFVTDEELYW